MAHKLLGEHFRGQLQTLRELMAPALYSDAVQQVKCWINIFPNTHHQHEHVNSC